MSQFAVGESELLMVFMSIRILAIERLHILTKRVALCVCKSSSNDPALSVVFRLSVVISCGCNGDHTSIYE